MFYRLVLFTTLMVASPIARSAEPLRVVALHTILAEIAGEVGGTGVTVTALVKPGVDPHTFEPSVKDIMPLAAADLVLAGGLHLEIYLERITVNAGPRAKLVAVGDALPIVLAMNAVHHSTAPVARLTQQRLLLADTREPDPHWWHSIDNVIFATDLIRAEFSQLRPASAEEFSRGAQRYQQRLFALKAWAARTVASLPPERRILVTSHDAFGYFAHEWGFNVYAVSGLSADAEPGARHVVALVELIKRERVASVFVENIANSKAVEVLAQESGARLGGALYADGLGAAGSSGATYETMMRHNLITIVDGLTAGAPQPTRQTRK